MSTATKPRSTARKASAARKRARTSAAKTPGMKVFAARAAARLKAWYGDRVIADSGPLLDELRKDASA